LLKPALAASVLSLIQKREALTENKGNIKAFHCNLIVLFSVYDKNNK